MGAGKSMLYSCLLDHRSWFAPSTCHSKPTCALWRTSKSLTDAKLCVGKAETYQVKKRTRDCHNFMKVATDPIIARGLQARVRFLAFWRSRGTPDFSGLRAGGGPVACQARAGRGPVEGRSQCRQRAGRMTVLDSILKILNFDSISTFCTLDISENF